MSGETCPISVCIIARDEDHQIRESLDSIVKAKPFEIIVIVDDRTTDNTEQIAKEYTDKVFTVTGQRGKLRNVGWQKTTCDFICYIDADMKIPQDYLWHLLKVFKSQEDVAMVGARLLPLGNALPGILEWIVWDRPGIFGTGGSMYRISALRSLNGFKDELNAGEDSDLSRRMEQEGWKRVLVETTKSYHRFSQSWDVLLNKWRHGRTGGITLKFLLVTLASPIRGIGIAIKYRNPHILWFYPFRFFYLLFFGGKKDYIPRKY